MTDAPVLFVDDEEDLRLAAEQTLSLADLPMVPCPDAAAALEHLSDTFPGIVVTDIRMPGMDGTELMEAALNRDPDLPVILVTGHGDVDLAVQSMRRGAYDFIEKPYDPSRLVAIIRRALEKRRLTLELRALRAKAVGLGGDTIAARLTGGSDVIRTLRAEIRAIAGTEADVLIEGATGTGKGVAAQALHASSPRSERPFVAINCAALPEALIESELFGHAQGAFPGATRPRYGKFEHARGGTLFLDQVDSLPLALQAKLLAVLHDRIVTPLGSNDPVTLDLRVIAASGRDLQKAVADGAFRDDLYYRLNVVTLKMPPLSARREDIPALFQVLLAEAAARHDRPLPDIPAAELSALAARDWPGNVRELRNAAERRVLNLDLPRTDATPGRLADRMADHERALIAATLSSHDGSIKATYETLGISRKALYEKMQKYKLDRDKFRRR